MYMCFQYTYLLCGYDEASGVDCDLNLGCTRRLKMSERGRKITGELTCRYWVFEIHTLLSSIGLKIGMIYVDYVRETGLMLYSFLKESKSPSFPLYCSTKFDTTLDIWEKQISSSYSDKYQFLTYSLTVGFQRRNDFFDRSFH